MTTKRSKKRRSRGQSSAEKLEVEGEAEGGNWDGLPPEVLDMFFQHLPVEDLLSCSVVSKNWKRAARYVLKRNRECYAHIKYFHRDIEGLNKMIDSTDIMEMINGLHIRNEVWWKEKREKNSHFWQQWPSRCSDIAKILQSEEAGRTLDEAKKKVCNVLCGQWRYLDLDMGFGRRRRHVPVDKGLLLREVILAASDSLQKLVIEQDRDWKLIPSCAKQYPELRVIQAQQNQHLNCCSNNSLSNFAPNLEKITGVMMRLHVQRPQGRFMLERMKSISVVQKLAVPKDEAREVFQCVLGLHRLDLQNYHLQADCQEQDLTSWHSFVFPFVLRSLSTLKELRMYTLELYSLAMATDGLKFPNLQRLSLATNDGVSMANEISILQNLNLPKLCPNLEQMELTQARCGHDVEYDVFPGGEADGLEQSDMPLDIDLNCRDGLYCHEHLELFTTIYPKLNLVRILNLKNLGYYEISKIFWEFQFLEYLEIKLHPRAEKIELGIDALLCGINIEEAKLPLLKYQKKKDRLNSCIVPIRPSLLNARNLKALKITEHPQPGNFVRSWVTQVTENLPERHVRDMRVIFDGSTILYDRMNRMRAFTWLQVNKIES